MFRRGQWLTVATCLAASFYIGVAPIIYNDFWLQAKVGTLIAEQMRIPMTLLFPYTEIASETFNAHEWLASVLFHVALLIFGEHGLPILLGLLSALLFASAAALAYLRNGGRLDLALGCGLLAIWAENYRHWLRPELLSLLLMLWFWIAAECYLRSRNRWALAGAVLLTVAWTNCHGSFVLAPIIAGLYTASSVWQILRSRDKGTHAAHVLRDPASGLLTLVLLATLINPFGIHMHIFVLEFSTATYVREYVPEWNSIFDGRHSNARGFYIGMAIWAAVLIRMALDGLRGHLRITEALFFTAFSFLGFYSIRFLVYFGLVAAFVFSAPRPSLALPPGAVRAIVAAAALASLLLAILFGNAYKATPLTPPPNVKFTPGLVDALANPQLSGHVLNSVELGAELVYRAYPRLKPSVDSRIDSYGLDYLMYQHALLEDDALLREYVARYDVRYVLLDSVRFETFSRLSSWQRGEWHVLYKSSKEVLLVRHDLAPPVSGASR
ncbi:MAG: hypothetical protein H7Y28_07105 [Rhodoferax sp.]|nr:hypothetical protein [Rhodoferax sp.]